MESRSIVVTTDFKWEEGDGLVREMNSRTVNPKKLQGNKEAVSALVQNWIFCRSKTRQISA
jgi:hypothetical protein